MSNPKVNEDIVPVPNQCEICSYICEKTTHSKFELDMEVKYGNFCVYMEIYDALPVENTKCDIRLEENNVETVNTITKVQFCRK